MDTFRWKILAVGCILLALPGSPRTGLQAAEPGIEFGEAAAPFDLVVRLDPADPLAISMERGAVRLGFREGSRLVSLNGVNLYLGVPVTRMGTRFFLDTRDWRRLLRPILYPAGEQAVPIPRKVMIDPGHGGTDPGAEAAGVEEKDLNLRLSALLADRLVARGFVVETTRTDDRFLSLEERSELANRAGVDLFLSIHFNAAAPEVAGIETYILPLQGHPSTGRDSPALDDRLFEPGNRYDGWNAILGFYIQRSLVTALPDEPDRGLKRARFGVLKGLDCPGVLLELGFLTNPASRARLARPDYLEGLADRVANGVSLYRRTIERLNGIPTQ